MYLKLLTLFIGDKLCVPRDKDYITNTLKTGKYDLILITLCKSATVLFTRIMCPIAYRLQTGSV